jgi:alkanesulfonate monooxygenase SsuD/methylene tetrahydromethanopterin reductase-like flavin-dependent oxidoreductase (luciferase family)
MSVITDTTDREAAHAKARDAVAASLGRTVRPTTLAWLGYTDKQIAELNDDLVNALVAHGDPDSIATLAAAHRDAGADHVILLPSGAADLMTGVEQLEHLAPTMLHVR